MSEVTDSRAPRSVLIGQLTADLRPVWVRSSRALALRYLGILVASGVVFFVGMGLLFGAWAGVSLAEIVRSLVFLVLSAGFGSLLLARYSRPGPTAARGAPVGLLCVLAGLALVEADRWLAHVDVAAWGPPWTGGWSCAVSALAMGAIMAAFLLVQLRNEAPVRLGAVALYALLTAGAVATAVQQIHCPNQHPLHQLIWHAALPWALLALAAPVLSRRTLRW